MKDFSNYNFITDSVFVTDNDGGICYTNFAFREHYKNVLTDINKLVPFFDFDVCILDNSRILEFNPIILAQESPENYSCSAINVQSGRSYEIFKIKDESYNIYFIKSQKDDIALFDEQIKQLESENKKVEQLKQKAQTQAAKIAFLNRIYTITQKETETENILKYTFTELKSMFGIEKLFYAQKNGSNYEITNIFPEEYNTVVGESFIYNYTDSAVYNIYNYVKDFDFFNERARKVGVRVIIPVHDKKTMFGVLCFSLPKKHFSIIDDDFLNSLCSQLSSAILQAILLQQLKENQLQLINSEKMASLGNMISAVAHEINTPLGAIRSNNEILSRLIEKSYEEKLYDEKTFSIINSALSCDKEAIKRIMSIVKALKKFIRLDEAQMQLTDVNSEIDLTLDLCQHLIKNRINVIKKYENVPEIYTHPNMLNQVFMNLITNAAQSIKDKGIIEINTHCEGNNLIISIKDTGEGISEDIKSKIFMQGFTTKPKETGSGLGLSISKKIIEQLNGDIYFSSEKGEGAEFFVKLPYKESIK